MSDEVREVEVEKQEAQPVDDQPVSEPAAEAGEKTEKTFTQAELESIVKERLDRANAKAEKAAQAAREDAERKAAEEQGEFKQLYEKTLAELEAERNAVRKMELDSMRRNVAQEYGLPPQLASRLQGETEEEMATDAKTLAEALPKPSAPNINAGSGNGAQPTTSLGIDPDEFAAIYGVSVDSVKKVLGG